MGWFYLDQPENRALAERWKERPGMLGLRFYFNERHKEEWVTDGTLDWLWPAAERAGVPVSSRRTMPSSSAGRSVPVCSDFASTSMSGTRNRG